MGLPEVTTGPGGLVVNERTMAVFRTVLRRRLFAIFTLRSVRLFPGGQKKKSKVSTRGVEGGGCKLGVL